MDTINRFNGTMLALARQIREESQSVLAKATGISQPKLSRIERGLDFDSVSEEELRILSTHLNFPEAFFTLNERYFPSATPLHRKRQGLSQKVKNRIEAVANLIRIHFKIIEQDIEIDDKVPRIPIDENTTPVVAAQRVRAAFKLPLGPIENMTQILENHGIIVFPFHFGTTQLDAFTVIGDSTHPIVFINNQFPGDRVRLNLGHELGHIVMHDIPTENMEEEAWAFAGEFLCPRNEIFAELKNKKNIRDYAYLKQKWRVSMQSLIKRASDLNAIEPNTARYLWMQMSQLGYRTSEPFPIEVEETTLVKEVFEVLANELGYSEDQLLQIFNISKDDFDELYGPFLQPREKRRLRIVR